MAKISSILDGFFDLLLSPLAYMHPFWPLCAMSLLTGISMLIVFRFTSSQEGIRQSKDRIKAHLLEVRIFNDNLKILLSAQKHLLIANTKYLMYVLVPVLVMAIPVSEVLIQLNGWFGYEPLRVGDTAVINVYVRDDAHDALESLRIEAEPGLLIETPPVRVFSEGEISWRIRAVREGRHAVRISESDSVVRKEVVVSDSRLSRVTPRIAEASFINTFVNAGEAQIPKTMVVRQIEVVYPQRHIPLFGLRIHWLVIFFVLSLAFGFAFRRVVKVEI
jgi:uncharacterized membrane protein (DUF106 family)